jgi:hypothetical protein
MKCCHRGCIQLDQTNTEDLERYEVYTILGTLSVKRVYQVAGYRMFPHLLWHPHLETLRQLKMCCPVGLKVEPQMQIGRLEAKLISRKSLVIADFVALVC